MPVIGIDHVNIKTAKLGETLDFFRDVLRMKVVPPPGATDIENAGWVLDIKDDPVVHVGHVGLGYPGDDAAPVAASSGSGAVHHVALNCSAFEEMRDRFSALDLKFVENHVPQASLRQLFVHEPNGILIELNFRGE